MRTCHVLPASRADLDCAWYLDEAALVARRDRNRQFANAWQFEPLPDVRQASDERLLVGIGVERARRDAKAFGSTRHGRIVDRLHVDAVMVEQEPCGLAAARRIAEDDGDQVALSKAG